MNKKIENKSASLGFWSRHCEAMDYLHDNWFEQVPAPELPDSMRNLLQDEGSKNYLNRVFRAAEADQQEFIATIKDSIADHLRGSRIVSPPKNYKRTNWSFEMKVSTKRSGKELAYLNAWIDSAFKPDELCLVVTIWMKQARHDENRLLKLFAAAKFPDRKILREAVKGGSPGSVILFSRPFNRYLDEETGEVDLSKLAQDATRTIKKIDDVIWKKVGLL